LKHVNSSKVALIEMCSMLSLHNSISLLYSSFLKTLRLYSMYMGRTKTIPWTSSGFYLKIKNIWYILVNSLII